MVAYLIAKESGTLRNFVIWTLISGVVAAAISSALFYVGSGYLSTPTLTDQSLSGYIGIIIGAGVALGGSLVAIMLAERAVDSSDQQVKLTARANRIAERQTPEAQLASEAAAHYERLKGMLLTVPSIMRRAQRDGCFAPGGDRAILRDLVGLVSGPMRALLESSVPGMITNLACTLETRAQARGGSGAYEVQRQRYFEYAFSSISYDLVYIARALNASGTTNDDATLLQMHLQRFLHAIFSVVREIDRLLGAAQKEVKRLEDLGASAEREASTQADMYKKDPGQLSQFEISFIERVRPVVDLNSNLWLPDDFHKLAVFALKRSGNQNYSAATLLRPGVPVDSGGGLIFALHDSGHAQAMLEIESSTAKHGIPKIVRLDEGSWEGEAEGVSRKHVPIFWITEKAGDRIVQLQSYMEQKRGHWSKHVVVIDQIDLAGDSSNTPSMKYLTLFDQSMCWRAFNRVRDLLDAMKLDRYGSAETALPSRKRADAALREARHAFHARAGATRLALPGGHWLTGFVEPMFERAAAAVGSVPDNVPGFGLNWALQCNVLLEAIESDALYREESAMAGIDTATDRWATEDDEEEDGEEEEENADPGSVHPLQFVSDCYAEFRATLEELARAPLVERPWYAFAGINQPSLRDFGFPDTSFYGVAYVSSEFTLGESPLMDLLAQSRPIYRLF